MTRIEKTSECRLAKAVRAGLKQRRLKHSEMARVMVCFSTEKSERKLMPLKDHQQEVADAEGADAVNEYAQLPTFRVRTIPVMAAVPACMGNTLAGYVICELATQPMLGHAAIAAEADRLREKERQDAAKVKKAAKAGGTRTGGQKGGGKGESASSSSNVVREQSKESAVTVDSFVAGLTASPNDEQKQEKEHVPFVIKDRPKKEKQVSLSQLRSPEEEAMNSIANGGYKLPNDLMAG